MSAPDATGWAAPLPPTAVAVLLGGPSAEHDVSIVSGLAVARALAERDHVVSAWYLDLGGDWWVLPRELVSEPPDARAFDDPASLGAVGPASAANAVETLARADPRPVVFPALHGPFGEDGTVQALLGSAGLVCCGSGVAASAVGMDKTLFKRLCQGLGLPVLPWVDIVATRWRDDRVALLETSVGGGTIAVVVRRWVHRHPCHDDERDERAMRLDPMGWRSRSPTSIIRGSWRSRWSGAM